MKIRAQDAVIKTDSKKAAMGNKEKKLKKKKLKQDFEKKFLETKSINCSSPEKWYQEAPYSRDMVPNEINYEVVQNLTKQAASIYNEAVILNNSKPPKSLSSSDYAWVKTVMSKGTKTDRIAAYTLLIQDMPLYNLNLLRNMIDMVKIGKNKECFMAIGTLSELFLNDLLPSDRKLQKFVEQPLSKLDELSSGNIIRRKRQLLLWHFEDQLKSLYGDFVDNLNKITHDSVDSNKEKVITVMCKLLEGNPEKENILLNNIVNKLGDPSHKVGSKVIYALTKLLETHPNMREVVVDAVEKVIFRNNINKRAQYYSICFLSQFCLSSGDVKIAKKLISIYLSLFKACIKTGDVDSRMMSALLTGVNRAYPYAKEELGMLKDHINTIYKVIHLSHANIAIQALSLVYLISDYSNAFIDRFYSVLYKKIGESEMFKSSHHAMLLSLIFKALKKDKERIRVCAFVKRLLQICMHVPVPVACGILIIISEVIKLKGNALIKESICEAKITVKLEEESDDGEEHYEDVKEESSPVEANESPAEVNEAKPDISLEYTIKSTKELKVWSNPDKSVSRMQDAEIRNYDPFVRNPLYSGADKSLSCELLKLSSHFHPTVSLFANKIINGEKIIYSGDPLLDFTLIRFLDKFSFKNPKVIKSEEDQNLTFSKFGRKKYYSSTTVRRLRANTADYLNHSEKNIPVDEIFLYRYMKEKMQKGPPAKKKEDGSDVESVGSDEFDEMLSGLADGQKDEINFRNEVGLLTKKTKAKKDEEKSESEPEMEFEGEENDLGDDASVAESLAEDFEGDEIDDFGDDDEEMLGSELDEDELEANFKGLNLPNLPNVKKPRDRFKKKSKDHVNNLFASAEEFSELLEEADHNAGGSEALSNKDRAGIKQLKWESDRDKWIHRKNYKNKGIKRKHFGKKNQKLLKGGKKKRL